MKSVFLMSIAVFFINFDTFSQQSQQAKQQPLALQQDPEDEKALDLLRVFFTQVIPGIITVGTGKNNPEQQSAGVSMITQALSNFFSTISRDPKIADLFKEHNEVAVENLVRKLMEMPVA